MSGSMVSANNRLQSLPVPLPAVTGRSYSHSQTRASVHEPRPECRRLRRDNHWSQSLLPALLPPALLLPAVLLSAVLLSAVMLSAVLLSAVLLSTVAATSVRADEPAQPSAGTRRALIICGHPGDEQHETEFLGTIGTLFRGLTDQHGFAIENIRLLVGSDVEDASLQEAHPVLDTLNATLSTKEGVASAAKELVQTAAADDIVWVIVMGHTHLDRSRSFFNLPGPDMQQTQFAKLFDELQAREQVFFITMPASGYYIKPLSREGRVIITATEADLEINGTLFPSVLADALADAPSEEFDADADGRYSLFDLYIRVTTAVAQQYLDEELLSTEHANLDDNADGRGSELQRDWLKEELGGRTGPPRQTKPRPGQDGFLSTSVLVFTDL